jgi:hypothetical protein
MLRKVVGALFVVTLFVGIALADEFTAVITKVEGNKVTFAKTKFDKETKKLEKGSEETLPVSDKVKVVKGKRNKETKKVEAGDEIEGGLKNEKLTKAISDKGLNAVIITDNDNKQVTEIRVTGGGKKKDKQ